MLNNYLTRNDSAQSGTGLRSISPNQLLKPGKGFSPSNPGDLSEVRTVEVESRYRPATKQQVGQARANASKAQAQAKRDEQYYRALAKHETADARSQAAYRGYQGATAGAGLKKNTANANYGKRLTTIAPQYARNSMSLGAAQDEAAIKFQELQYQYNRR